MDAIVTVKGFHGILRIYIAPPTQKRAVTIVSMSTSGVLKFLYAKSRNKNPSTKLVAVMVVNPEVTFRITLRFRIGLPVIVIAESGPRSTYFSLLSILLITSDVVFPEMSSI